MERYKTFKEFYPYYLSEHDNKYTKLLHFVGTSFAIFFYVQFFRTFDFMFSLLAGYGFAWAAHFFVEHNKPATFTYPFYSFIGDHKMYIEILLGKHKIF